MKKIFVIALVSAIAFTVPVHAQTSNDEDVKSDVNALDKDNAALQKDQNTLARDRAAKATDKANGNSGQQAVDSVKIGAVKTAISEKNAEKDVDQKILNHHKAQMKDSSPSDSSSSN